MILTEQVDGSVCGLGTYLACFFISDTVTWASDCSYVTTLLVT